RRLAASETESTLNRFSSDPDVPPPHGVAIAPLHYPSRPARFPRSGLSFQNRRDRTANRPNPPTGLRNRPPPPAASPLPPPANVQGRNHRRHLQCRPANRGGGESHAAEAVAGARAGRGNRS